MAATLKLSGSKYAAVLALAYALLAGTYIFVSSQWAADASLSVEEMARIETIKGIAYVAVTAVLVYFGAAWAMARMARDAEELRRRERALVAADGRVLAGLIASSVAHDTNNVLFVALGDVQELLKSATAEQRECAERLSRSLQRLVQLQRKLVQASQQGLARDRHPVDLLQAARDTVADLRARRDVRSCRISVHGDGDCVVLANSMAIEQVLSNLVLNAAQATSGQGQIELRVRRSGAEFVLEVHDDGPGVPLPKRPQIFSALESTKSEGHGLGLFSVRACVESLGGRVELDVSPLGGALFRVVLPQHAQLAAV